MFSYNTSIQRKHLKHKKKTQKQSDFDKIICFESYKLTLFLLGIAGIFVVFN